MCGIGGYIGPGRLDDARVAEGLAAMEHRGPDHAGHHHAVTPKGEHVHLLSTRLNIIDLHARADQPFAIGPLVLVYNGELYNYLEVREQLERRNAPFATESDTEVLLRAIHDEGWDALESCEGMWAFAVYDATDGSLTLCRDRFGEKPLYILRDETGFYFGSEVKVIAALRGKWPQPNLDQLFRYMVNGYKALYKSGTGFFEGVEELSPGSRLRMTSSRSGAAERYWSPEFAKPRDLSYDEAVAGVREALLRAVEIRLRADVPLAFCMSGGVDSVSLISIAKRVFDYDVHAFTIVNTDARYEEQDMIHHAVDALGIRHTEIPADTAGFLTKLRGLVRHHDAPVSTITFYAHWLLMQSIGAHGYRIAVSGTGADELFTGYYDHHLLYLREIAGDNHLHGRSLAAWQQHIAPVVRNPHLQDPDLFVRDPGFRDHIYMNADEFSGYLQRSWREPFDEQRFTESLLRNRLLNELFVETVPVTLHEDDLNAMYFSIENRSPYLDRALFELSQQIPVPYLVRDGYAKAVLRDAMRGIAPDRIVDNRRKVGFNAPIFSFLDVNDRAVRDEILGESAIWEHVRRDRIAELLDRDWLPNSDSKFLFYFLNCKLFLDEFAS